MISVPFGTGDIADAMISALQMIYASRMKGTDIISYLHRKYIIRQSRISYRDSDISLKQTVCIFGEYTQKIDILRKKGVDFFTSSLLTIH